MSSSRGFLRPSLRPEPNEAQTRFASLSRARRTKLAKAAQTNLLKADQWARTGGVSADLAKALERGVSELKGG